LIFSIVSDAYQYKVAGNKIGVRIEHLGFNIYTDKGGERLRAVW